MGGIVLLSEERTWHGVIQEIISLLLYPEETVTMIAPFVDFGYIKS